MNQSIQIEQCVTAFIKAGDLNDVSALEEVLHPNFQNVQDGFFSEKGLFQISKEDYKRLVGEKTFGGTPRSIVIRSIEPHGPHMARVRVRLESGTLIFDSLLVTVREQGDWQVLYNFPKVEPKNRFPGDVDL